EQRAAFRQYAAEAESLVVQVGKLGCAQMSARMARMLDDHGGGQAALFKPFFQHDAHAARFGQNGDERDFLVVGCHVGQVDRQARAHDNGVRAAFASLFYQGGMVTYRFHDVDGDEPPPAGALAGSADFAVERHAVGLVDGGDRKSTRLNSSHVKIAYAV